MIKGIQIHRPGVPLDSPGRMPHHPTLHERQYISETVEIPTPKLYIFFFLMIKGIGLHRFWVPSGRACGHAPPLSLHKRPYIWETFQIPTPKPYIFVFLMIRVIHCHRQWVPRGSPGGIPPPLHFIKCVISQKPLRPLPINHIYSCSSETQTLGACPIPFISIKALYLWNRLGPHP